jgi:hypothetical protein
MSIISRNLVGSPDLDTLPGFRNRSIIKEERMESELVREARRRDQITDGEIRLM